MKGICYRLPDGRRCNQIIDLNIDSPDLGFISAECKSIKNSSENNTNIAGKAVILNIILIKVKLAG